MMFNYDAESNAMSILRAMCRETVPSRCIQPNSSKTDQHWLVGLCIFIVFSYLFIYTVIKFFINSH